MNTLSITSTKTMTYNAAEAAEGFALVERLVVTATALIQAFRRSGSVSTAKALPAIRA